jgi:hypothetical protein
LKSIIGSAAFVAAGLLATMSAAPAQQPPAFSPGGSTACAAKTKGPKLAPADEYFGPLKMSFLGIRNNLHDLTLEYDAMPDKHDAIFGKAVQTETSLKDWERKYPADGAVPRQIYFLRMLYAKFDVSYPEAQTKRVATEKWLLTCYSATWYAKDVRTKLASATPAPAAPAAPASQPSGPAAPAMLPTSPANAGGTGTLNATPAPPPSGAPHQP